MCQYCIQHKRGQSLLNSKVGGTTYAFIEVLDPHVSNDPMFSMSSFPEESESHLLPDESCELWDGRSALNQTCSAVPQTSSTIRTNYIIEFQSLIFDGPVRLCLLQSTRGIIVVLFDIDELSS